MQGAAQQFDKLLRKLLNRVASEFSPAQFMRQAAAAPEAAPELQPTSSSSAEMELPSDADIAVLGNESIWLELISSLTGMLVKHLPDFWQLLQVRGPQEVTCTAVNTVTHPSKHSELPQTCGNTADVLMLTKIAAANILYGIQIKQLTALRTRKNTLSARSMHSNPEAHLHA